MARLYAWMGSDTALVEHGIRGNETIAVRVNYGSKKESKLAVRVRVTWHMGDEKPTVYVYPIDVKDVQVCQNR